jgi:hypothetical protein
LIPGSKRDQNLPTLHLTLRPSHSIYYHHQIDPFVVGERRSKFSGVVVLCPLWLVADRRKMNVIGIQQQPMYTYCVQVVAGRKKIICILPSVPGVLVPERSNVPTCTLVFFWGKFPSLDDTTKNK